MVQLVAVLAWPFVVLSLGTLAILVFRRPLGSFLGRLRTAKLWTAVVDAAPVVEAQTAARLESQDPLNDKAPTALDETLVPAMIREMCERIAEDPLLNARPTAEAREKLLIRHLAYAQAGMFFEYVYRLIFNSQIVTIREANGASGISTERAHEIYGAAATASPHGYALLPFPQWLQFIAEHAQLVTMVDGRLVSTERGQEFLRYLLAQRYDDKGYLP